jgi:hypothetical protein
LAWPELALDDVQRHALARSSVLLGSDPARTYAGTDPISFSIDESFASAFDARAARQPFWL